MADWAIQFEPRALKELDKLGATDRRRVLRFLRGRVVALSNPRQLGSPLKGSLAEYWRYRVGDIRILCRIDNGKLVVVVVEIGNHREIYR